MSSETVDDEVVETTTNDPPATPLTYEALVSGMDATQRQVLDAHTAGLKTALQAERDARKRLETQVKTEKAQAETAQAQAAREAQRAAFYATAAHQGVRRSSMYLAYVAAQDAGLVGADGTVDWDAIRAKFGDLFDGRTAPPPPPAHPASAAAGAGTGTAAPTTTSINQLIRNAARR